MCQYGYQGIMIIVTRGTTKKIRIALFEKLQKISLAHIEERQHGDIMNIFTNDTEILRQLISQRIPQVVSSLLLLTNIVIIMLLLHPGLFCISAIDSFMIYICIYQITKQYALFYATIRENGKYK